MYKNLDNLHRNSGNRQIAIKSQKLKRTPDVTSPRFLLANNIIRTMQNAKY